MVMPHRGSKDDSALQSASPGMYSGAFPQLSVDNLPLSAFSGSPFFNSNYADGTQPQLMGLTSPGGQDDMQFSPSESNPDNLLNEILGTANTSPINNRAPQFPSAPESFQASSEDLSFMAADLPLNPAVASATMAARAVSNSDESLLHSGPGLTAGSSGTPSEMGDVNVFATGMDTGFDLSSVIGNPVDIQGFGFEQNTLSPSQKLEQMATTPSEPMMQPFPFDGMTIPADPKVSPIQSSKAPTSDPTSTGRRSLDVNSIRKLSAYPDFGDTLESYLNQSSLATNVNVETASLAPSFASTSGNPFDTQNAFVSNSNPATQSNAFIPTPNNTSIENSGNATRPRSATVPFDMNNFDYDPNITVNNMYPQLDQDFTNAAAWDPSALDLGATNWLFQPQ